MHVVKTVKCFIGKDDGQHEMIYILYAIQTIWCIAMIHKYHYNTVNFLPDPHKMHPIARPGGAIVEVICAGTTLALFEGQQSVLCRHLCPEWIPVGSNSYLYSDWVTSVMSTISCHNGTWLYIIHLKKYSHDLCRVLLWFGTCWFYPYPSGLLHCHWLCRMNGALSSMGNDFTNCISALGNADMQLVEIIDRKYKYIFMSFQEKSHIILWFY